MFSLDFCYHAPTRKWFCGNALSLGRLARIERMDRSKALLGSIVALALLAAVPVRAAIIFAQIDTFENGTTNNWAENIKSPNPPTNTLGGPGGSADHYMRDVASGIGAEGSRQIVFNLAQWTGNYVAAGVNRITCNLANFGVNPLAMRFVIQGGQFGGFYGSTAAFQLPVDGGIWHDASFDLTDSGMSLIQGVDSLSSVLSSASQLRLLSASDAPAVVGDAINSIVGVDNILATATPEPTAAAAVIAVAAACLARKRRPSPRLTRCRA